MVSIVTRSAKWRHLVFGPAFIGESISGLATLTEEARDLSTINTRADEHLTRVTTRCPVPQLPQLPPSPQTCVILSATVVAPMLSILTRSAKWGHLVFGPAAVIGESISGLATITGVARDLSTIITP